MIKKKLNILLLLLLALLFIGSFSTTYAVSISFMENYITYINDTFNTTTTNYMVAELNSNRWYFFVDKYESLVETFDNFCLILPTSDIGGFRCLLWDDDNILGYYDYGNKTVAFSKTADIYVTNIYVPWNADELTDLSDSTAIKSRFPQYQNMDYNLYLFYIGTNKVYTNSQLTDVSNNNYLYSEYTDDSFDFDINSDFTTVRLQNDQSLNDYYLVESSSNEYIRIGNQYDFSNLQGIVKRKFRYNIGSGQFDLINEYQSDLTNSDYFTISEEEDICILYETHQPDVIEVISLIPFDLETYQQIDIYLYFSSRYTSIVNGVVDFDNTFSGDYYNNYNNDTNTESIINNINDDIQVDNTLNNFISGDAEDIANKFGFRLFNIEYYNFIHDTIVRLTNVLTEEEDVYFDYSMHGETPTRLYASSFTTPNGALKTFISLFLISCTVFAFYKYIADLLELISTGNILDALDEFKVDRNIFKM